MQIRYLEAMQSMAKSANSKVIFLPGVGTGNLPAQMMAAEQNGEGPSSYGVTQDNEFGTNSGIQKAINAHVVENI
jgi:erythrocyte band 7 integral membrane protein